MYLLGLGSDKSRNGISRLLSLRVLTLLHSNVHGDVSLLKELQLLENLQDLSITVSTELSLKQILGDQRLANCITSLEIIDFQEKPLDLSSLESIENLCKLLVTNSHVSEINNPTRPCFTNLSHVNIIKSHRMRDLTWLLFAPNLVDLRISDSREVEEIINKEKATKLTGITPFLKLEFLHLENLPKLKSICWSPLPFPFLRELGVSDCPKLRKLPLNATSVPRVEEFKIVMEETEFEWEDEDTKNRFLPSLNRDWDF